MKLSPPSPSPASLPLPTDHIIPCAPALPSATVKASPSPPPPLGRQHGPGSTAPAPWQAMLERGRPPGGGAAHAAAAAAAAAALPLLTAEPKPFLRRGAGWAARMEAAREGRRYVPRGGPVKDYSQEGEAPLPRRTRPRGAVAPSRIPRSPAKQPRAAKPAPAGAGYDARRAAAAAAAPQQHHPQGRPQRSHPASPRPPPNNAAAATPRRAAQAGAPPVASASSGDHWARKLLGQVPTAPTPAQRPSWEAQQEHEVGAAPRLGYGGEGAQGLRLVLWSTCSLRRASRPASPSQSSTRCGGAASAAANTRTHMPRPHSAPIPRRALPAGAGLNGRVQGAGEPGAA